MAQAGPLGAFAEALVARDELGLGRSREELLAGLGPDGFVDAAAVASNFQRMVRIADATGIPLDAPLQLLSEDLRGELGLGRFGSAANTPPSGRFGRVAGRVLRPVAQAALRGLGAWRRRQKR